MRAIAAFGARRLRERGGFCVCETRTCAGRYILRVLAAPCMSMKWSIDLVIDSNSRNIFIDF